MVNVMIKQKQLLLLLLKEREKKLTEEKGSDLLTSTV